MPRASLASPWITPGRVVAVFRLAAIFSVALAAAIRADAVAPARTTEQRHTFAHSIRAVPAVAVDARGQSNRAFVTRTTLRPDEMAAPMRFEIALAMRNFAELEARLAHSEIIPFAEMQARYLPLPAEHERVVRWLEAEGLKVTRTDANRLAVFARGSVAEVGRVFEATFARVAADGAEFTSAVSPPSVPAQVAPAIRGIRGLQPHQRLHRRPHTTLRPLAGTAGSLPYYPGQIAQAYNATGLGLTGAGQTIAIYALGFADAGDLNTFWNTTGVTTTASNIQNVRVGAGPNPRTSAGAIQEATLDVEWASALAPDAMIRVYAADENDPVGDDELIQQVLADLPTQPTLHQLTISYGLDENGADRDYVAIEAQYMAALVSAGVTVFAASGDNGALDNPKQTIQTGFPASMPDVTAVGGTTLTLDASGDIASEIAWGNLANSGSTGASGGGVSVIFSRPAWQTGAGVPAGTMRLVPDVAAVGDPATGGLLVYNGTQYRIGGTSLASPIWAAWCAMLNQARAGAGKPPLGALNPRLYPLAGTAAFRDITSGGNSVFAATAGYDLCTGLGVPNVAALLRATMNDTFAPVLEVQSGDRFTTTGQTATFYVIATGAPDPTYRWQRLPAGTNVWNDLADGAAFAGTRTFALTVANASLAMNSDRFRCVVTNGGGSITTPADTLTVGAFGVSTVAGWPGWSGFADGQGASGRFNYTGSVRVALDGTIYVADASNHTVRKISPAGLVTTVAGAPGVSGSTDGPGAVARFNGPAGVAIDPTGNVFVADSQNFTIRKITPAGVVSTLAGNPGVAGHADGTGSAATFFDPENLAIDAAGNLYIADGQGNVVRKVTPAGVVTTLAGAAQSGTADGTGSAARFNLLAGIAVDATGNVFVGDYTNNAVRKITPDGVVTTLAGLPGRRNFGFADGTGSAARFDGPTGLAVDASGSVFVADSNNNAIRRITAAGVVTTLAGSPTDPENIDGPLGVARFNGPADVALDRDGVLYVADALNCTVRRLVLPNGSAPVITVQPQSVAVAAGGTLTLTAAASASGALTYQWNKDGLAIPGATNPAYTLTAATAAAAGGYTLTATAASGSTVSAPAIVAVAGSIPGALTNLSVRSGAGTGAQTLAVGFVFSGTANKTLIVRGIGPGLAPFGVTSALADPVLTVYGPDSTSVVAANNDNWTPTDAGAMAALGAFPLTAGSKDAALVTALRPGAYSAQITAPAGATGLALAEIYDTAPGAGARLINLSARAQVDTGAGILIAGFTIVGSGGKTILIRGIGPGLAQFGVTGVLADPRLDVFNGNTLVQGNDNWDAALASRFTQVGAFALAPASQDAALVVTLPPGSYTAQVSGVNGTAGVALVEIYEVGN